MRILGSVPSTFLVLIAFQLFGEILHHSLQLPLPGPVIGMFMLAAVLVFVEVPPALAQTANALLGHMGLLFVPAGVGIMTEIDLLRHGWLPIIAGVIGSTLLTLIVTGFVLAKLSDE